MKTTYDNTNNQTADMNAIVGQINTSDVNTLSLAEFNRLHAEEILRKSATKKAHEDQMKITKMFEYGSIALFLTTAGASAIGLLTMIAH